MLIGSELNGFFTKAAIKPGFSKSLFAEMIFEPRGIPLKLTSHQYHVFLPTLSSINTPAPVSSVGRVSVPPLSRTGRWRVKLDIHSVEFHLVSCDSLFILSNLLDS